ncbi:MAG: hypothetical protein V1928_03565, partial [Parcubacteria group bacterium]
SLAIKLSLDRRLLRPLRSLAIKLSTADKTLSSPLDRFFYFLKLSIVCEENIVKQCRQKKFSGCFYYCHNE